MFLHVSRYESQKESKGTPVLLPSIHQRNIRQVSNLKIILAVRTVLRVHYYSPLTRFQFNAVPRKNSSDNRLQIFSLQIVFF